jgi:hypothetical protein
MALAVGVGVTLKDGDTGWFFGEDQARYLLATQDGQAVVDAANKAGVPALVIGNFGGSNIGLGGDRVSLMDVRSAFQNCLPKIFD